MRVLDLFSGIGGFSLGLERAGMRTVAFCEIDPYCQAVLRKHWPGVFIYDDIRTLDADRLFQNSHGELPDVICGGFPCQDISEAGPLAGIDGERSGLWSEYARLISEIRPQYVIVENVAALLGRGLDRVLGDLATRGYDAWWECLRACDVGAPHIRDRVWIVAYPQGSKEGRAVAENCHRKFEETRAFKGSQARGRAGDLGGQEWNPEPSICRVVDGVRSNVDAVGALGNAVVPKIPQIIGSVIMNSSHQHEPV